MARARNRPRRSRPGGQVNLLRWTRFRDVSELRWKERKSVTTSGGKIDITAFRVKHWGARKQRDIYRGYNGYVLERNNRRLLFSGDTALSDSFAELRAFGPIDLAIMPIGTYNPWIHWHWAYKAPSRFSTSPAPWWKFMTCR